MAVPPRLPNLDPKDMQWVRWTTDELTKLNRAHATLKANLAAGAQQRAANQAASATQTQSNNGGIKIEVPVGPPQVPTDPTLTTDHGTVTIKWDGQVHANLPYVPPEGDDKGAIQYPAPGFNHVNVQRALSIAGPYTTVGANLGHSGSIVDGNVGVGDTYFYQLVSTDNLGAISLPSTPVSIVVQGVDLGSLNSDVTDAIQSAQDAAAAGLAAGQAGQQAAADAQAAADSVASQAADALSTAQDAQQTAQSAYAAAEEAAGGATSVVIQSTTPDGATAVLWIDTTNGANTPKRWDGSAWVAITDKAAVDAAAAAVVAKNAADAAQATANTAVTNAQTAQTSADAALTAANGKNKVIYSASAASGTAGYISGDLWFQTDSNNKILGQWQFNGTAWVAQTVSGTLIASGIDAGNITVGTLSANRIGANSIAASQMIAGTITAASGILADAVITNAKIADAAVNNAKIANLAVNDAKINDLNGNKIQAATIVAGKLAAGSVTTNNIVAGAIDTNRLAAGAITADKLSLGAVTSQGTPIDRVPMALTNVSYWSSVIAGATKINPNSNGTGWTASVNGIIAPTTSGTTQTNLYITNTQAVPESRKVNISAAGTFTGPSGSGEVVLRWQGGTTTYEIISTPGTATYTAPDDATSYDVFLEVKPPGTGAALFSAVHVFEIIGNSSASGQAAELSPGGLRLFDTNSNLALDLTTESQQFLNIYDNTQAEPISVASIDSAGNAAFNEVSANNGFDISGILLTDVTNPDSLFNASPNGSAWDPNAVPMLDRLSRGVIYDVGWTNMDGYSPSSTAQYIRIAQDQFILEDGRTYMILANMGGLRMDNTSAVNGAASGVNVYVELQLNSVPNVAIRAGATVQRAVVFNNMRGYFALSPIILTATSAISASQFAATSTDPTADDNAIAYLTQHLVPANTPIYWQINVNMSTVPDRRIVFNQDTAMNGLSVIDMGSSNLTKPGGNDNVSMATDHTTETGSTSSSSSGSTTSGTTATSKTVTFTAKSSRTWNNSGSTIVTGTGQYTNGAAMYYGVGNTPMGSWFGDFRTSDNHTIGFILGGKTITSAVLTVKNTYTYMSAGATVQFGTASATTAPSSISTPANNTFNATFSKGSSKSMTLSSSIRSGLSNGSVNSFVLGVSSSVTNYSYFHGASQSYPPTLKVTYH